MNKTSLIITAHGSRRTQANVDFINLASKIKESKSDFHVQPAFLELAHPNIQESIQKCVEIGSQKIIVLPYFLSEGNHTLIDIPAIIKNSGEKYPTIEFSIKLPIGKYSKMIDFILEILDED